MGLITDSNRNHPRLAHPTILRDLIVRTVRPEMLPTDGLMLSVANSLATVSNSSIEETPRVTLAMSKFPAYATVINGIEVSIAFLSSLTVPIRF